MELNRIIPAHNLFGDHGPRCPHCSGLGKNFQLPTSSGGLTRHTSTCSCRGTGVDQELVRESEFSRLIKRIDTLERQLTKEAARRKAIESKLRHGGKMSRQYWAECIAWATADGAAVGNTTTEAIIHPDVTIPANYMNDGRQLRAELWGRWSNVVTATPTMTFAIRWGGVGGTLLATSPAVVTPATATTNAMWHLEALLQTRANGTSGSIFATLKLTVCEDAAPTFGTVTNYGVVTIGGSAGAAAPAAVTVDLTIDKALSFTLDWSAADASNTGQGHQYSLWSAN